MFIMARRKSGANMHVFKTVLFLGAFDIYHGFWFERKGSASYQQASEPERTSLSLNNSSAAESTVSPSSSSSSSGSSSSSFMVEVKHEASMPTLATATAMPKLFSSCQESDAYLMYKSGRSLQVIFTAKIRSLFVRDKPSNTTKYKWDSLIIWPLPLWPLQFLFYFFTYQ